MALRHVLASLSCLSAVTAQFPPKPEGVTVLKSKFHEGVKISYKEPGICETTPGVRSYSGYVHLPPHSLTEPGEGQDYPINTFFWFFEARKDPHNAPLTIWLNGGPGGSSLTGALAENGPCFIGNDSNSTYLNPWSWNNEVNMLYIDQPNQVGFSYGVPTNVTVNLDWGFWSDGQPVQAANFSDGVPEQNNTFLVGTLGSQKLSYTANSTNHSAVALWHFAQTWFEEFPAYKPHDERISLWTESYGGKYGPGFMQYFQRQNELIANGTISGPGTHFLHLDTLGIINGCIDSLCQGRSYIEFPWKNTYGIKGINETTYHRNMYEALRPGGFEDTVKECQQAAREMDPGEIGDIEEVAQICNNASLIEMEFIESYMESSKYGWFDITHPGADPFPSMYGLGFLNQHWVQKALGTPVNFTFASPAVAEAFQSTGDFSRGGQLEEIAYLLESGVKVALAYGDRDYACNWIGGEVSSKSIPYRDQASFNAAGYTTFVTNPFYSGGLTRQYGNYSFTRVYQAGHMIPSYQPETAYRIFMRSLFNKDIATGSVDITDDYSTEGSESTWDHLNDALPAPEPECYVWMGESCPEEQRQWLRDGTAIVKNWIVVGREEADVDQNGRIATPFDDGQIVMAASG